MEQFGELVRQFFVGISLLVFFALIALVFVLPAAKILRRTGHNPAWCLVLFIPEVAYIGLWIFAFQKWPIDDAGFQAK
jgi:hypothetical protein